ncbi:MAG: glycosyltransferase family 2 protein [Bacteroidia bacterium]
MGIELIGWGLALSYFNVKVLLALLMRRTELSAAAPPPAQADILIAVRNEASNLPTLISHLDALPPSFRILWGEDQSTDETYQLLQKAATTRPHWEIHPIRENLPGLKAKHNVLAHLQRHIRSPYVLLTDGDMRPTPAWATSHLRALQEPNVGIVCGPSIPEGKTLWAKFQKMEWLWVLGLLCAYERWHRPTTAIGNNLSIRTQALESMGGWQKMPFSYVEDVALLKGLTQRGWDYRWLFHPDAVLITAPLASFRTWLHQRRRWALGVPKKDFLPLVYYLLFGASWLVAFWIPETLILKLIAEIFFLWRIEGILGLRRAPQWYPLAFTGLLLYLVLPPLLGKSFYWKGRLHAQG